jgi:dTDP-4-amino-4,6-dideoxygalactose transaminase
MQASLRRQMSRPTSTIPFVDLGAHLDSVRTEVDEAVQRVIASNRFILGPELEAFEQAFAQWCGTRNAVGLASGTDALAIALRAAGVSAGDEVIVPAMTFVATAMAVVAAGATPVFCDVLDDTRCMDPESAAAVVGDATKAIIPVHLYGRCADMDAINALASEHGLTVIEDAAQAHGAELAGRRAGTLGHVGCFSFYPSKNLGAFGDAGAVVTSDDEIAERVRALRNYGESSRYHSDSIGFNSRLDELQAAVLRVMLPHVDGWNDSRRALARAYGEKLAGSPLGLPHDPADATHVWHLYAVRSADRDALQAQLQDQGVFAQIHYPLAVHQQPPFRGTERVALPVSEALAREVLSLPMYPELGEDGVARVCEAVSSASA